MASFFSPPQNTYLASTWEQACQSYIRGSIKDGLKARFILFPWVIIAGVLSGFSQYARVFKSLTLTWYRSGFDAAKKEAGEHLFAMIKCFAIALTLVLVVTLGFFIGRFSYFYQPIPIPNKTKVTFYPADNIEVSYVECSANAFSSYAKFHGYGLDVRYRDNMSEVDTDEGVKIACTPDDASRQPIPELTMTVHAGMRTIGGATRDIIFSGPFKCATNHADTKHTFDSIIEHAGFFKI
jgi:hypothetical protein